MSGLDAARKGRGIYKSFSDTLVVTTSAAVSTKSSIYFNLSATTASRVLITKLFVGSHSTKSGAHGTVGWSATSGPHSTAGSFTALSIDYGFHVGANRLREDTGQYCFDPPLQVTYTGMGARCVTIRHRVLTTAHAMNLGWSGWYETE